MRGPAPYAEALPRSRGCLLPPARVTTPWLPVQQLLEFLPCLEEGHFLGRDGHRGAGLWISAFLHAPGAQTEAAESANLRLVALLERVPDAVEDGIDDDLHLSLGQRGDLLGD